jgi:serine/threonine protein phosphatase PrpC
MGASSGKERKGKGLCEREEEEPRAGARKAGAHPAAAPAARPAPAAPASAPAPAPAPAGTRGGDSRPWKDVQVVGVEASEGSGVCELRGGLSVQAACVIQGLKREQDRFVIVPSLLSDPACLLAGVFDGHGRDGEVVAESVAAVLPKLLRQRLQAAAAAAALAPDSVRPAFVAAFKEVQSLLDAQFEEDVVQPIRKLVLESAHKSTLGEPELPLGSGSTATLALATADALHVAHVGDSRAVLCRRAPGGALRAEVLTADHNVVSSARGELEQLEARGGCIMGRHIAANGVDGMLQLTRSLGDVPLHRKSIVRDEPEVTSLTRTGDELFLLIASDGLWDHVSPAEAVEWVAERAPGAVPPGASEAEARAKVLAAIRDVCSATADHAKVGGKPMDDITVLVVTLQPFWGVAPRLS